MTTLSDLSSGPVAAKTWLNIVCDNITASSVTAASFIGPVVGNEVTLTETASVANPAVGKLSLYANLSGQVSTNDALGNVVTLLDNPSSQDENMNGHIITGVLSETFSGDITLLAASGGANVLIGGGSASAPLNSSLVLDLLGGSCNSNASNQILAGTSINSNGQYTISLGANNTSTNSAQVNLGINVSNGQANSVAIGPSVTAIAGGQDAIVIGSGSSIGAFSECTVVGQVCTASAALTVTVGSNATNAIANSVLLGDNAVANIRANSLICDLGTSAVPFASARLGALRLVTGANKTVGSGAVMVGGAVTVNTSAVSTGDIVLTSRTAIGGTTGNQYISAIVNGTSFTITSSNALDTSTFSWVIVKQA